MCSHTAKVGVGQELRMYQVCGTMMNLTGQLSMPVVDKVLNEQTKCQHAWCSLPQGIK